MQASTAGTRFGDSGNWLSPRHLPKTHHYESMSRVFLQLLVDVLAIHTRIPQERGFSNPTTDDELKKRSRTDRPQPYSSVVECNRPISATSRLKWTMGTFAYFMDPGEVTLVDVEVVRLLTESEDRGIVLVHCPPYVREWILRERAEGAQPQVPNGV